MQVYSANILITIKIQEEQKLIQKRGPRFA